MVYPPSAPLGWKVLMYPDYGPWRVLPGVDPGLEGHPGVDPGLEGHPGWVQVSRIIQGGFRSRESSRVGPGLEVWNPVSRCGILSRGCQNCGRQQYEGPARVGVLGSLLFVVSPLMVPVLSVAFTSINAVINGVL